MCHLQGVPVQLAEHLNLHQTGNPCVVREDFQTNWRDVEYSSYTTTDDQAGFPVCPMFSGLVTENTCPTDLPQVNAEDSCPEGTYDDEPTYGVPSQGSIGVTQMWDGKDCEIHGHHTWRSLRTRSTAIRPDSVDLAEELQHMSNAVVFECILKWIREDFTSLVNADGSLNTTEAHRLQNRIMRMGRPHNQKIRASDLRGAVNGRLTDAGYRKLWDMLTKANVVLRHRGQRQKKQDKKFRRAQGLCDETESLQIGKELRRGNRSMRNLEGVVEGLDPRLLEMIHQAIDAVSYTHLTLPTNREV